VAKKVRTPSPGPRQQGPRRRDSKPGQFRPLGLDKRGLIAGIVAGLVVIVAIVAVVVARGSGGGSKSSTTALAALNAAGCSYRRYPSEGRGHVSSLSAKVSYKTFPPTSGTHYYVPAVWNRYTQPLVLIQEVHNLEHGGVIIQYGDKVPQATVAKLVSFYNSSPNGMLLAPLPKLGNKIALTAWTRLALCAQYNQAAFAGFRDAFRGIGPERFPVSSLTPGS
jgi:hypothetical protein